MSEIVGYQLVDTDGAVVQSWGGVWGQCPGVPAMVELPNGDHVHAPQLNTPYQEWTLVPWNMEPPAPSTNPADFPLSDWQLRLGLIHFGFSLESIESQIHGIADTPTRQTMWTQWDRPTVIYWDNPATAALMAFIGVTPEQAAPMWLYAKDLTM